MIIDSSLVLERHAISPGRSSHLVIPGDLYPRALGNPDAVVRRQALHNCNFSHMAPLNELVRHWRSLDAASYVPDFDPVGGGVEAKVLFLYEKPGPMATKGKGSGFLSMHNDDPTAEASYRFTLIENRLLMPWCLSANVIPGWDGNRKVTASAKIAARPALAELLGLLKQLQAVILVGKTAQNIWLDNGLQLPKGARLWASAHPSPLVRASHPKIWHNIPKHWPSFEDIE